MSFSNSVWVGITMYTIFKALLPLLVSSFVQLTKN